MFLRDFSSSAVIVFILQKSGCERLKEEDVAVSNVRIDLTRGRHNPLERFVKMDQPITVLAQDFSLSHFHYDSEPLNLFCFVCFSLYALVGHVASASIHFFKVQTMASISLSIKNSIFPALTVNDFD